MTGTRWRHVFFGATMLALLAIGFLAEDWLSAEQVTITVTVVLLLLAYASFGRHGAENPRIGFWFVVVLIAGSGVLVSVNPNLAIAQCIVIPTLWTMLRTVRAGVIATTVLVVVTILGFGVALGQTWDVYTQAISIEGITLVGSIALGIWITRIAVLSHERQRLLDDLTAAQDRLSVMSRDAGVVSERERLAGEIHDTIAQTLTGMVLLAQGAQRQLAAGETAPLAERLTLLEQSAREALVETRSLVAATAPVELGAGIGDALARLAGRFTRETGIVVSAESVGVADSPPLGRDTEVVLLRCAQEGLANVRKHSAASSARLLLTAHPDAVSLDITDNGTGFDAATAPAGFGLSGMQRRLALVGGTLTINSSPSEGTTIAVVLTTVPAHPVLPVLL